MKTFFSCIGLTFLALVFEGAFRHFPLVSVRVDFVWIVVLFVGFSVPVLPGVFLIFLIGLIAETSGASLHGILTLVYLLIYFFLRITRNQLFFQGFASQMIWIGILSLTRKGLEQGFLSWQGYPFYFDLWSDGLACFCEAAVAAGIFSLFKNSEGMLSDHGA